MPRALLFRRHDLQTIAELFGLVGDRSAFQNLAGLALELSGDNQVTLTRAQKDSKSRGLNVVLTMSGSFCEDVTNNSHLAKTSILISTPTRPSPRTRDYALKCEKPDTALQASLWIKNKEKKTVEMKIQDILKENAIPILIEVIFLTVAILGIGKPLYTNFLFYGALILFFAIQKKMDLKGWFQSLRTPKSWKNVVLILAFVLVGGLLVFLLGKLFPNVPMGDIKLRTDKSAFEMVLFSLQTMIMGPIAEELFFRKSLIPLSHSKTTLRMAFISSALYSLEHAYLPFGFLLFFIIGMSFSLSYIKTKNIYAMITSHLLINILGNGIPILLFLFESF